MEAGVNPRRQQLQLVHCVPDRHSHYYHGHDVNGDYDDDDDFDYDDDCDDYDYDDDDDDDDYQVTTAKTDKISEKMRRPRRVCKCFVENKKMKIFSSSSSSSWSSSSLPSLS